MNFDPEILALNKVYESLRGLNYHQVKRIVNWLKDKFGIEIPEAAPISAAVAGVGVTDSNARMEQDGSAGLGAMRPGLVDGKGQGRGYMKENTQEIPYSGPSVIVKTALTGFLKYESLDDVFKVVSVRKGTEKILITAAFLQEGKNYKEMSSYDISSALKGIGNQIVHVSGLINSLMTRTPPYLVEIGKYSYGKHGRRKFRVTEEGLKAARNYIQ